MSIGSKYSESERKQLDKLTYMREATFDEILNLSDITFNVAALIRESTKSAEQEKAFNIQKDMVIDLINKKDNFILDERNIFCELGYSGLRASGRPEFQEMVRRASQHSFDILVVDAVSRLARNIRELNDVIDDLCELGIGIIILKERYWTYNMEPSDVLRLAVDSGLSQAESMTTGRRVENHMAALARQGQLLGGNMFGYRLKKAVDSMGNPLPQDNCLIQEPVEAYIVKEIFRLYTSDDPDEVMASSSICKYLIDNNMRTYSGDLGWTPAKVIQVLEHTKYMGYQLPNKSETINTVKKKRRLTKIEPTRDVVDENGNVVEASNLVRIKCEPIVTEEVWWKAYDRRMSRSCKNSENIKGRKSGLRVSADAFGRKAYCSCGYCLSRQYGHAATETRSAVHRYKCRWQVDHASKYTIGGAIKGKGIVCNNPAVSDVKAWLCGKRVFAYLFKNGRSAVLQALDIIQSCKQDDEVLEEGNSLAGLKNERTKLKTRIKNLQEMCADGDISLNDYKERKSEAEERIQTIDNLITQYEVNKAKQNKKKEFDIEAIRERLNTIIDLRSCKVSDEIIDMFVERVIYRGIVDGNDEFLWVMNLSGECTDTSAKYKIRGYDKEYSDFLKSDKNFNIVARMLVSLEECKRFCVDEAHRRFRANIWRPIVIKIAIQ